MSLPKLDVVKFAQTHRLEYAEPGQHHHTHQGWIQLHCPFCGSGTSGFHLGFSLTRGSLNCWKCGGHSAWDYVAAVLRTRRSDLIMEQFGKHSRADEVVKRQVEAQRTKELKAIPGLGPLSRRHKRYLARRGFNVRAIAEEWDLRGTKHLSGDWSWRVVSPICAVDGKPVAYVGRSIWKNVHPKYKVTDAEDCVVDPRSLLYGVHRVDGDGVVIVEGPADVWRLGPGAVATLGISWKRKQADQLRLFRRRFVLYDPVHKDDPEAVDRHAQRRAQKLAEYLALFPGETEVVDGLKSDPGDLSDARARRLMRELLGVRAIPR